MIRPYLPNDLAAAAGVWYRAGMDEYDYLPLFQALSTADATTIFRDRIAAECTVWVHERDTQVDGFIAMASDYIDRLYVDPLAQRRGVGTALLAHAKQLHPEGLTLHTHQANARARRFYEKHGFTASEFGVSPPPESVPDVLYTWAGDYG